MKRSDRRGFTFVELMVVIIVIGVLATMAVMRYIELKHRALSAQATSDMENIRLSAYTKFYDTGQWPSAPGPGVMPPELAPYLGQGFRFQRPEYTLEFQNLVPPGGGTTPTYQVGLRLTTTDQNLMNTLVQTVGNRSPYFVLGNSLVVVLVGPDGQT
jgi:prepilin-type N-terminal cleavage/methylation domain-containing protein